MACGKRSRRAGRWAAEPLEPRRLLAGTISGTVWEDRDGDGTRDQGEALLPGVTVYADADNDAVPDAGEPTATTDAQGRYELPALPAGRHLVRQVAPAGHAPSFPSSGPPAVAATVEGINISEDGALNGFLPRPPDPIGAVGPDHLVSMVNRAIEWHTKAGVQQRSTSLASFFAPLSAQNPFDPKVVYDQHAGRFVAMCVDVTFVEDGFSANTSRLLVAVSDDSDPNGTWRMGAVNAKVNVGGTDG